MKPAVFFFREIVKMNIRFLPPNILKQVNITKSKIPILFLDANFVVELKKTEDGNNTSKYADQFNELLILLKNATKIDKIRCAFGEQDEEIGRTEHKLQIVHFLRSLTQGVKLKSPEDIKNFQTNAAFLYFLDNASQINIFFEDGYEQYGQVYAKRNISFDWIDPPEFRRLLNKEKDTLAASMNQAKENHQFYSDFLEQLALELTYEARVRYPSCIRKYLEKKPFDAVDLEFWNEMNSRMYQYRTIAGFNFNGDMTSAYSKYHSFLTSVYFFQIPFIDIERKIQTYYLFTLCPR